MTKFIGLLFCGVSLINLNITGQNKEHTITLKFINTIKSFPIKLEEENYTNTIKEIYSISTLKYYISNIQLNSSGYNFKEPNSYHLIDESDSGSKRFSFIAPANNFNTISFLLGVDSLKNVSGAQTAALDPLNGMFWTWNTGYIMFKLEGQSPFSPIVNHKIEYHIGGFKGENNVLQRIVLKLPANNKILKKMSHTEIIIGMDLENFWDLTKAFTISNKPACTAPGAEAAKIAAIYSKLFHLIKIIPNSL